MLYLFIMGFALAINVAAALDQEMSAQARATFGVAALASALLMMNEVRKLLT